MVEIEEPLAGGNMSTVVRVGETVRRSMRPWSPSIHLLLRHLETKGFLGAPRFLGIDEQGREILSFVPGEVGNYPLQPYMWSDESLAAAARLLRGLHEATRDFVPPPDAVWQQADPDPSQHEVICHNDFAPYNTVFVDELPRAVIDFDVAGHGPRIWDIAYAVYTFVPLASFTPVAGGAVGPYETARDAAERGRRLRLFCDAYGLEFRDALLLVVERRLDAMCRSLTDGAARGDANSQRLIDEGHLDHYRREIDFLRHHMEEWRPSLE